MAISNYIKANKKYWNDTVSVHTASSFYNMDDFLRGKSSLQPIELSLLGNIKGKSILHLQCHFGQDSISLARRGAMVTGVDFSDKAIDSAKELARKTGTSVKFVCCDIYSLPEYLEGKFDIVFTSYGTIGWLPDLKKWAFIISKYLKAGGFFVMVDFHPVVWMLDNDFKKITYRYFNDKPIVEETLGTYANRKAPMQHKTISWNHSIGEILNNLIKNGLQIDAFNEYDYSPYNCFKHTVEIAPDRFQIKHLGNKIPMMYSIKALKKNYRKKSGSRGI
ncbi:MAG: class I SAM-dependent methyltransferase [Niabella sp.]